MKQRDNDKKIIVEFQGGGACWDQSTCEMQQAYLSFPDYYDSFVGMSCSEIEYGAAVQGGNPLSLLCAKSVGGTDFTEYNTIVVPYWYVLFEDAFPFRWLKNDMKNLHFISNIVF